jgi:hypothetical protein
MNAPANGPDVAGRFMAILALMALVALFST